MFFIDVFLKALKPNFDDDAVDRLNYYYTPMLIMIFALTLSAKQYVGQPIQCWIPAQFTGAWEQYSENYCFVQNTYFLPLKHYIPHELGEREGREIGYYQWVPFILGLQAILFYLPSMFWRILNWQSGISVKSLIKMSKVTSNVAYDRRQQSVVVIAAHIHDSLRAQKKLADLSNYTGFMHQGRYLVTLYLITKVFYIVQVVLQFVILNSFLSTDYSTKYTLWGFGILRDLAYGREWEESGHFPRVTMCDFEVRVLGNLHRHTVQCVLMINMFNEKVYLFLWWWFLLVAVATIISTFFWIWQMFSNSKKREFIVKYLSVMNLYNPQEISQERAADAFVEEGLRDDGVFVVKLISSNAGDLITTELVGELWNRFLQDKKREVEDSPSAPLISHDDDGFTEKTPLA